MFLNLKSLNDFFVKFQTEKYSKKLLVLNVFEFLDFVLYLNGKFNLFSGCAGHIELTIADHVAAFICLVVCQVSFF